jgi:hypothetical protein
MIHLGTTQMNRAPRGMSFIQNLLFQDLFLWHNHPILKPQCTFCILMEANNLWFTFLHSSLDVAHALIILLCCNDLTHQGGCGGNVEHQQVR